MTSAGAPDPDEALIEIADQRYHHGDWSAALLLYKGLQRRQSALAIARGILETAVEGDLKLTPERYANLLRESPVTVNLSRRATGVGIITARTIEALSVGGVLLEEDSFDTRYFLTPGVHYMPSRPGPI